MNTYIVNFTSKSTDKIVKTVEVKSDNNIGIILKGKLKALSDGFRCDRRKHTASFMEL